MRVERAGNGEWIVTVDGKAIETFSTNTDAWRWVDRKSSEHVSPAERRSDYGWSCYVRE